MCIFYSIYPVNHLLESQKLCVFLDARNVLKTPNHAVQNQTVKVKLHHECIGLLPDWFDSSRPPVDGPIETRVSCGSKNIVLFLLQSQKQMKLLEDNLKSLSAEVEWPNVDKHTAGMC